MFSDEFGARANITEGRGAEEQAVAYSVGRASAVGCEKANGTEVVVVPNIKRTQSSASENTNNGIDGGE